MAQISSLDISSLPVGESCPWCDQSIPHEQFKTLQARVEREKEEHAAAIKAEAKSQVDAVRSRAAAELKLAEEASERDIAAAHAEGKAASDAEMIQKLADAEEARSAAEQTLAAELKLAEEASERDIAAAHAEGKAASDAEMIQKLADAEEARSAAEQTCVSQQVQHDLVLHERLLEQRAALEKDKINVLNSEKAKASEEQQKLERKVDELQREVKKLDARKATEGADIDVVEDLRTAFPGDKIVYVKNGEPGANVVHEVFENGRLCGTIVYDAKPKTSWRSSYVSKLRADQLAAKADHAILACGMFPAGEHQLGVRNGVIVTNLARVVALTEILRQQIVQSSTLRLSNEAREQKASRLYEFITSEHCSQLLDEVDSLAESMLDLDVEEQKAHKATWNKRGELLRSAQRANRALTTEIDSIVAAPARDDQEVT